MEKRTAGRFYLAIGAITGWFSVILQFYLIILNREMSVWATVVKFFSFFTILTNILAAISFSTLLLKPKSSLGNFLSKPSTLTATTVYITFVGISYSLLLRHLWNPQRWQLIADELLHSIMPIVFILFWLLFVPKSGLDWKNIIAWFIYPLIYLVYILTRGAITKEYPYPFIDVNKLGYEKALIMSGVLLTAFLFISLLFVGISKFISRST